MSNIAASEARTVYNSSNGTSMRDRAAATNANTLNESTSGLLLGYFFHGFVKVNYRSFLNFDLSGESGTVTAVSLTLTRKNTGNFADQFVLASEAGNNLAVTDYQDGIVGATGYPFTNDATKFTDSADTLSDGGGDGDTFTINLNAAAVSHANTVIGTSNRFKCALVNTHDFLDTYDADDDGFTPALALQGLQVNSTDNDSADYPVLNLTFGAASPKVGPLKLEGAKLQIVSGKFLID
tara:strand:+ start:84 stop:797 length:714 start_codon:yes stop_codon:yes gene_type:complete